MEYNDFEHAKTILKQKLEDHTAIFIKGVPKTNLYMMSFVMFGALQRSLWNTSGFLKNIDESYIVCSIILRCQMDTLMRLYAYKIYPEPNHMAQEVLYNNAKFKNFYIIVNGKKQKFTDKFLHEELNKIYPWFTNVYETLSGYVHFGDVYGKLPIENAVDEGENLMATLRLSISDSSAVSENSREEITACMADTTDIILTLIYDFLKKSKIE